MTITRRQVLKGGAVSAVAATSVGSLAQPAFAGGTNPFVGEIIMFAGNFAPTGFALCDGQLLSIASNTALFSLLGTTYGGDGETTFALPDLRGRAPVHQGTGLGLTPAPIGQRSGAETVTLNSTHLPTHHHRAMGSSDPSTSASPHSGVWAQSLSGPYARKNEVTLVPMAPGVLSPVGGAPHDNMLPFQTISFCIALFGIFPSE